MAAVVVVLTLVLSAGGLYVAEKCEPPQACLNAAGWLALDQPLSSQKNTRTREPWEFRPMASSSSKPDPGFVPLKIPARGLELWQPHGLAPFAALTRLGQHMPCPTPALVPQR